MLRTFAEMVTSASETKGCSSASWVKTIAHAVELLNFVQDRIRMHGVHGFPDPEGAASIGAGSPSPNFHLEPSGLKDSVARLGS